MLVLGESGMNVSAFTVFLLPLVEEQRATATHQRNLDIPRVVMTKHLHVTILKPYFESRN